MLVWKAMPSMTLMMSAIFFELSAISHGFHHAIHHAAAALRRLEALSAS
jgi:hypothetical protein